MLKSLALFLPEIKELLKERRFQELKDLFKEIHSVDLVEGWDEFSPQEAIVIFRLLSRQKAIEVFEDLDFSQQSVLLKNLEQQEMSEILNEMAPDERADLFGELSERMRKKLFSVMRKEEVEDVKELLTYPEDTAGGIMTTEFVELRKDLTARAAILRLQQLQRLHKGEIIQPIYVTAPNHKLLGEVPLNILISAPPDMLISNLMLPVKLIKINANLDQEEAAKIFAKYDLVTAPVVDNKDRILGTITVDDIVDVIQREATEDIYGMGKIGGVKEAVEINYATASVFTLVRKKIGWIVILLLFGTFVTGRILKGFSDVLQSMVILACFIPMLTDSGGNAGQQSLVLITRGLATGEVVLRDIFRIIYKELCSGLLMGIIAGIIGMTSVFILQGFNFLLGLVVLLSLTSVIVIATVVGATLPLVFKWLGFDPAVAASPFITTFVDAACVIVYFTIARCLLF